MILYIIDFIFTNLDYTLYILLFSHYMKKKAWTTIPCITMMILFTSALDLTAGLLEIHLFSVAVNAVLLLALSIFLFEGNLKLRMVLISLSLLFSFLMEMGSGFFWSAFFHIEAVALIDYKEHMLLATAFYLAVKMIAVLLLPWFAGKQGSGELASAFQLRMALLPLFSLLGILICGYQFLLKADPDYLAIVTVGLIIGLLNIVYFLVLASHTRLYRENLNNQIAAREYEMKEDYYQALDRHQKEIRTIKHDLKNQILTITGAMEESGSDHAIEQLSMIMQDLQGHRQLHFSAHSGLNILLSSKYRRAETEQISCDFEIKVPETLAMKEKDLGSLLGNILDNAIEGCLHCIPERRYIRLKMIYFKNSLVIQSENRTDGRIKDLSTRKQDSKNHGLGMSSIARIVDHYHGNMEYNIARDHFQLNITLWF